jgi:hypothetical protein
MGEEGHVMRRILAVVGLALGLSGCLSDQMNTGLSFMVGQNIQFAVSRLGYPDGQREMLGDTIYVWSTSREVNLPMMTTSTTTGSVGTVPIYGQTMSTQFVPANFNCTIELGAGPDNIIKSWQWSGNIGGCMQYARALQQGLPRQQGDTMQGVQ